LQKVGYCRKVFSQKRFVWTWLQSIFKTEESPRMLQSINHLGCEKIETKNFGLVHRARVNSHSVFFQPSKIIVGEFNDEQELEEALNLGRLESPEVVLDDNEKLDSYVPPSADSFRKSYFLNSISDPSASCVLSVPAVYESLPKLSPCVLGITFMNNNTQVYDLVAEYEYKEKKELDQDLALLVTVYEAQRQTDNQEKE